MICTWKLVVAAIAKTSCGIASCGKSQNRASVSPQFDTPDERVGPSGGVEYDLSWKVVTLVLTSNQSIGAAVKNKGKFDTVQ